MRPTRREFFLSMGAIAAAYGLRQVPDVYWAGDIPEDVGWAPGLETHPTSVCLVCPARCGVQARVVDGRLVHLTGNRLHPMSQGGLCPRGVAGVQMLYHPRRISGPLIRTGERGEGGWRQASRDEALAEIGNRLGTLRADGRPEALALVAGYCAGTMQDLWRQFMSAFGSPNYIADDYYDGSSAIMSLMHGKPRAPSYDLERAEFVLSFGAPLFESWWSPLQAFVAFAGSEEMAGRNRRFIQVDTRFSRTAARTHEWVGIRPGTHATLALGIAYVLLRDELIDAQFVAERVSGFDDFVDESGVMQEGYRSVVTRHYRSEDVSAATGVPVERITSLARAFATNPAPLAVCGSDVLLAPNGLLAGMAVHSLNVITGRINHPGGVQFGDAPPVTPLVDPVLDSTSRAGLSRDPISGTRPAFGEGNQAMRFAEAIAGSTEAPVDALMLYYANPLESSARPEVWARALEKIPFVVSFSPFLDETTRHADVVLPDLLPYERWQDGPAPSSYPYPVWGIAQPLVEPAPGAVHTGEALLALARSLGGSLEQSLPYDSVEATLQARARGLFEAASGMIFADEFERLHHREMEERGWWLPEHTEFEEFWQTLVERGGWMNLFYDDTDPIRLAETASGRIELMPAQLRRALQAAARELYIDVGPGDETSGEEYPLRLIPYRVSTLSSGTLALERWMVEQPGVFPDVQWVPWVEVAEADAEEMGFHDGSMVWVVSSNGRYRARLKAFPGTAHGTVCAPYGLVHPDGETANPLRLLDGATDPLTGLPSWFTTFVRLEQA